MNQRTLIKHVLASAEAIESVTVKGWVRTRRDSRGFSFLASNRTIRAQCLSGLELADWLAHYAREMELAAKTAWQLKELLDKGETSSAGSVRYVLSSGYYDAYYLRAQKVRTLIRNDFKAAFEKCDVIAHPVAPTPAFKIGEKTDDPLAMYLGDIYTVTANLVGLPAISAPCGNASNGLPVGIQFTAGACGESVLLKMAAAAESRVSRSFDGTMDQVVVA